MATISSMQSCQYECTIAPVNDKKWSVHNRVVSRLCFIILMMGKENYIGWYQITIVNLLFAIQQLIFAATLLWREMKRQTCVTVRPLWYAERVRAGRGVSVQPCGQASHPTPGSDRRMTGEQSVMPPPAAAGWAPAPSCSPSRWGSRPGLLQTARTNIPAAGCGTAAHRKRLLSVILSYWQKVSRYKATLMSLVFTLGLLQLETILSIRLFRSSILGMLSLHKKSDSTVFKRKSCKGRTQEKEERNMERMSCTHFLLLCACNNRVESNIVSITGKFMTVCAPQHVHIGLLETGVLQTRSNVTAIHTVAIKQTAPHSSLWTLTLIKQHIVPAVKNVQVKIKALSYLGTRSFPSTTETTKSFE